MMSKITGILIFCLGAAAGAAGAWIFAKKTFSELARTEIESVKEVYKAKTETADNLSDAFCQAADISEKSARAFDEFRKVVHNNGYEESSDDISQSSPSAAYIISPDAFGELDYEQISLNYWLDGYLTDEDDGIIKDPESIVGNEALGKLDDDNDAVYVRDDELRVDYEILLDKRKFSDFFAKVYPGKKLE